MSHVKCHVSLVTYHLSPVTNHLLLMPTAMDPHPAYFPTLHSRLVCKDTKIIRNKKKCIESFKHKSVLVFQYW